MMYGNNTNYILYLYLYNKIDYKNIIKSIPK